MDISFKTLLTNFNENFTLFLVFPSIIFLGLYLTIQLKCAQITKLKTGFACLLKKDEASQGNISHYEAISTVLAGNFGTGNISGMAVALTAGGPGALVWMWIMAFLGSIIQYVSCILGVKYRLKNSENEYVGGPMYYLRDGLGFKKLGAAFALFVIIGSLTVGNFAQINSVVLPLQKLGFNPFICSCILAVLVGMVLIGGIKRLAGLASYIIPIKAALYLGTALIIILFHIDQVWPAFKLMIEAAFSGHSITGGVLGFSTYKAITSGFDRGLFATDAGTGIVPILQASAKTTSPVIDGLVTLVAPFLVMIVCTTTGLVLIITGTWQHADLRSTNMVTYAFEQGLGHSFGSHVVIIALLLFAYTTILAWAYCAEKALGFLFGNKKTSWFKYLYVSLIPIGTLIHVDLIWILADISISFMLITNLAGIALLSREAIDESNRFFLEKIPATELLSIK